jgi:DNA-binding LacI/PurR family transcriptional regulator
VPDDVSLVSFGDSGRDGAVLRRLTAVTIDEADTGRRAAALLGRLARGGAAPGPDASGLLSVNLSTGESLGPPRAS